MINKLLASQDPPVTEVNSCQPRVIIVSPTRELAIQIFEQAKKFAFNSIVKTVVAYGGVSVSYQRNHVLVSKEIITKTNTLQIAKVIIDVDLCRPDVSFVLSEWLSYSRRDTWEIERFREAWARFVCFRPVLCVG